MQSIWSLLDQYNFVDPSQNDELICILCRKIVTDARQGPCGCKYCYKCVNIYLSKESLMCPGKTNECNEEELDLEQNISMDHLTNRRVAKLRVKCPIGDCLFEEQLINMSAHLLDGGHDKIVCPFFALGCTETSFNKSEIDHHLTKEVYDHSGLMMKTVENLKNDIALLKKELDSVQKETKRKQAYIDQLERKIDDLTDRFDEKEDIDESFKDDSYKYATGASNIFAKAHHFIIEIQSFPFKNDFNSKQFELNGYTFQLRLVTRKSLAIYVNCVNGKNSGITEWPLKCSVTLSLKNHTTNLYEYCQTKRIVYNYPTDRSNGFVFTNDKLSVSKAYGILILRCSITIF